MSEMPERRVCIRVNKIVVRKQLLIITELDLSRYCGVVTSIANKRLHQPRKSPS